MISNIGALDSGELALLIAVCTTVSYIGSLGWVRMVPLLFYPEERRLEKQIAEARAEAVRCNNSDNIHIHGKLTRRVQLLTKELACRRKHRYCTPYCQQMNKSANDEPQGNILKSCCARVTYAFPTLVRLFISFGFMIPVLLIYGNRPDLVIFPRCFCVCVPSLMAWIETAVMSVLLGPPLWGAGGPDASTGSGPAGGELFHTYKNKMTSNASGHSSSSSSSSSSSTVSGLAGANAAMMYAHSEKDGEPKSIGLVSWFLACYIAVRLSHRVLSAYYMGETQKR